MTAHGAQPPWVVQARQSQLVSWAVLRQVFELEMLGKCVKGMCVLGKVSA